MNSSESPRSDPPGRESGASEDLPYGRSPILDHASRRRFAELPERRERIPGEGDLRDAVTRARIVGYSLVGGVMGFLAGFAMVQLGGAPKWMPVLLLPLGIGVSYALMTGIVAGAGRVGSTVYMPSGSGAKKKREYSLAESLAVQGRYEDAISAFEMAVAEHPEDPTPYLRIARIYRDELERYDDAARWFRRGRRDADLSEGQEKLVYRELVELYRKAGTPKKAAPELARMAERFEGTDEGEWARRELAEVKRLIAEEEA